MLLRLFASGEWGYPKATIKAPAVKLRLFSPPSLYKLGRMLNRLRQHLISHLIFLTLK
ncbi:hypothetical protein XBJ2_440141 [Xenorhabdus bovienii str. Jollieti]|uniref:Uncharacterized protein n=1 Tax=Xenorhabdus bovienii (strain SS-2004) TaxID=406818 RepID=D3UXA2_XENBS|nr:hypothetical protein XBJ1_1073 [Xenorhabdus bovienii SS-2004]CDH29924.1 hypothetical protein XBJ2_440141 [Xenorhabdus bovienii str. Jollieti]